ncbi:hypothetical protein Tco_1052887, partial [Tanacetum coccineum]
EGGLKILKSPCGSSIPIGDGDGDEKQFPDGDEAEKRGWGCDEDLLFDEEIMLMGDIPFSDTDEEQPQGALTSRRYRTISMSGCVLLLRTRDAPTPVDQYIWMWDLQA